MLNDGWISVYRKIEENPIWTSKEPFDKRSAWIDLLLMANHKDKKIQVGNKILTIKSGQKFTSIRILAEKWNWSNGKVLRYLKMLEDDGMIQKSGTDNGTLITIVKYGFYQGSQNANKNTNGTPTEHSQNTNGTPTERERYTNNNDNNDNNVLIMNNNENNMAAAPFDDDDEGMDPMECFRIWKERNGEVRTECIQDYSNADTQYRLSKDRVRDSINTICPESKAPDRPAVITLSLNDKTEHPIYQEDIDGWKELYPAVDILQELRKMKGWLDANPTKRKTRRGIKRFINSWLSREQDKGGNKCSPEESAEVIRRRGQEERQRQWREEQKQLPHVPPVAPEDDIFG